MKLKYIYPIFFAVAVLFGHRCFAQPENTIMPLSGGEPNEIFINVPVASFDQSMVEVPSTGGQVSVRFTVNGPTPASNILNSITEQLDMTDLRHHLMSVDLSDYSGNVEGMINIDWAENTTGNTITIVFVATYNSISFVQSTRAPSVYRLTSPYAEIYPMQNVTFNLSGSDKYALYHLYRDNAMIDWRSGTGSAISIELPVTAGTYRMVATPLDVQMNGTVTLTHKPAFAAVHSLSMSSVSFTGNGGKQAIAFTPAVSVSAGDLAAGLEALNNGTITTWDNEQFRIDYVGGELVIYCKPNFSDEILTSNSYLQSSSSSTLICTQAGGGTLVEYTPVYNSSLRRLTLSGSQYGVTYQLLRNGESTGVSIDGMGDPITFDLFDEGEYTVWAVIGSRRAQMGGMVSVVEELASTTDNSNYIHKIVYTAERGLSKIEDITYYDGLGYPQQIINIGGAYNGGDIVQPIVYDPMRRADAKSYLPYVREISTGLMAESPLSEQQSYYADMFGPSDALHAYHENIYAPSVLNRIDAVYDVGAVFRSDDGHYTEHEYGTNVAADSIFKIEIQLPSNTLDVSGYYPVSSLRRSKVIDADGAAVITFTLIESDKTILTRALMPNGEYADTYYVYDMYGRLGWVVSPEGSDLLLSTSVWSIDSENAARYCYRYTYDGLGRQIEKRLPGKDVEYLIYDPAGRSVAVQDGNMREDGEWMFIQYDDLNRPVRQFMLASSETAASLRAMFESNPYPSILESTSGILLKETVYDTYPTTASAFIAVEGIVDDYDIRTTGQVTYERIAVLGGDSFMTRSYYYDYNGRPIQVIEKYPFNGTLVTSHKYDFVGNVVQTQQSYTHDGIEDRVAHTFNYDERNRLLSEITVLNGSEASVSEVWYSYDDLGHLIGKSYDSGANTISETFDYNIQGWPTSHNVTRGNTAIYSDMLRYYDGYLGSQPSYTGNISSWSWSHSGQDTNTYTFEYDNLSRLTDADHYVDGLLTNRFVEKGMTYDKNTNLLTIKRYGTSVQPHNMNFTYSGNQRNGFTYDGNGNITSDAELELSYNFLNLPAVIQDGTDIKVRYTYAADGTKLSAVDDSGEGYFYIGSFKYNCNGSTLDLESVASSGGRIYKTNTGYDKRYFISDHLGSTRVVLSATGTILEQNDYYPYGLRHSNASLVTSANPYLYGGKELQDAFGVDYYDSRARFQGTDGIFLSIDPLAEKFCSLSPYAYCGGNPVNYVDPFGMDIYRYDEKSKTFSLEVETDDDFDQIGMFDEVKDEDGNIRYVLQTRGKKSKPRIRMNRIAKGILSDGFSFNNENVLAAGGKGQLSQLSFEYFIKDFTSIYKLEISGFYYMDTENDNLKYIYISSALNNTSSRSFIGRNVNPNETMKAKGLGEGIYMHTSWHTHPNDPNYEFLKASRYDRDTQKFLKATFPGIKRYVILVRGYDPIEF